MNHNNKRLYSIEAKVDKVISGDTILVTMYVFPDLEYSNIKIRLEGITSEDNKNNTTDIKERAYKAKSTLEAMLLGKTVVVEFTNTKSFDKYVGNVYLTIEKGKPTDKEYTTKEINISEFMLKNGLVDKYIKNK